MSVKHKAVGAALALLVMTARGGSAAGKQGWRAEEPLGDPPAPRLSASAIYDPTRDRMVIFGGYAYGPPLRDSWLLLLNGRPKWTELNPAGPAPAGSWDHTAVYDPARDRVLFFGGVGITGDTAATDQDAVWSLDLAKPAWEPLAVTGAAPPPRDSHSAVYDPSGDRMIVFGGGGPDGLLDDSWSLALAGSPHWSAIQAAGTPPSPRARHSAIYDPDGDRLLVFGGATSFGEMLNDVWALSLGANPTWTRLDPGGTPPSPRAGHHAVYDPVARSMLVFGGCQAGSQPFASDLWELTLGDPPQWREIVATGLSPGGRFAPQLVFDGRKKRMVLSGGAAWAADLDLWSFGTTTGGEDEPRTFTIGPNPMKAGRRALTFYVPAAGSLEIELVDVTGRRVWKGPVRSFDAGWHSTTIDAGLAPGFYWVRALEDGATSAARLVVVR